MAARTVYFGSLFYGDMTPHIALWVRHFHDTQQLSLFHQIIDIGLGSIFPLLSCSMQSQIIESLAPRLKHSLLHHHNQSNKSRSLQFIQLRQKIYLLHNQEFIQFLCTLCTLLVEHNLFAKLLQYGFEHYRHQNKATMNILNCVIFDLCQRWNIAPKCIRNDKNTQQTLCFGFSRYYDVPSDIMHLCYYYYFILYHAQTEANISQQFGDKLVATNSLFMMLPKTETISCTNSVDLWDKSVTNHANTINTECNVVKRQKLHKKPKHEWFNAFGTKVISFGTNIVWNIRISPYIGNMLIGVMNCMDGNRKDNKYVLHNKRDDFAFNGFAFMPSSGMAYFGQKAKKITQKTYDYVPQNGVFNVMMMMDMTQFKCSLKIWIDNDEIGVIFDEEIDPTKKYKLAVSMHEAQSIQIV